MRTSSVLAGLLLAGLVAAPSGYAESGTARVHLQWSRPVGTTCITQGELENAVEAQLGRAVFVADDRADLRIGGEIEQRDAAWVATLRVDEPGGAIRGVRTLRQEDGDCAALNPALIVVIAMLIGLAQPHTDQAAALPIVLGAAGAVGFGVLPEPTPGGSLWLGVAFSERWLVWADASGWLPVEHLDAQRRGGEFNAFQAGLSLCRAFGQRIGFAACAGGELGLVYGQGRGLGPNRSSARLLAQPNLEAALSLRLVDGLALRTSAALGLALARPSFFIEEPSGAHRELFRTALLNVALRAGLMLELR
jgi:hypothetical protein